jgi:hypothetical protein
MTANDEPSLKVASLQHVSMGRRRHADAPNRLARCSVEHSFAKTGHIAHTPVLDTATVWALPECGQRHTARLKDSSTPAAMLQARR